MPMSDEPDDLADLAVRQDGQEQRVDPVAFGLIREDAVDEHGERPRFEDADRHRDGDEDHENGDQCPVGREIRHRPAVNVRLLGQARSPPAPSSGRAVDHRSRWLNRADPARFIRRPSWPGQAASFRFW